MLPFCRPADSSGDTKIFMLTDVSALTEWVDYIPVQEASLLATSANRFDALGYQEVNSLSDNTGLTAFVDYIPAYLVTGRSTPWSTDADGYIPVYAVTGSVSSGVYDDSVLFLAGFNGTDEDTTYTEEMFNTQRVGTFNGNAKLDDTDVILGSTSYRGDGTGDFITFPNDKAINLSGAAEFTIEFKIRFDTDVSGSTVGIMGAYGNTAGNMGWHISYVNTGIGFYYSDDGTSNTYFNLETWDPAANTTYSVAVVRDTAAKIYIFIDGVQLGTEWTMTPATTIFNTPHTFDIGHIDHSGVPLGVDGLIDEVRISNQARYVANYTPETTEFPRPDTAEVAETAWPDVDGWSWLKTTTLDAASNRAKGLCFNGDGTSMYYVDDSDDTVYYGTCATPYDPGTYVNVGTFDDTANTLWTQCQWSDDGTYFFVMDQFTDDIERFTCSTPYDLSTATTPHGQTWDYRASGDAQDDNVGWTFKADGTKLFMWCADKADAGVTKRLFSYSLSTAWDLTSITKDGGTAIAGATATTGGMAINSDGTIIYVRMDSNNIGQIDMSTGFDYTTATLNAANLEMSAFAPVPGQIQVIPNASRVLVINDDGTTTSVRSLHIA